MLRALATTSAIVLFPATDPAQEPAHQEGAIELQVTDADGAPVPSFEVDVLRVRVRERAARPAPTC